MIRKNIIKYFCAKTLINYQQNLRTERVINTFRQLINIYYKVKKLINILKYSSTI